MNQKLLDLCGGDPCSRFSTLSGRRPQCFFKLTAKTANYFTRVRLIYRNGFYREWASSQLVFCRAVNETDSAWIVCCCAAFGFILSLSASCCMYSLLISTPSFALISPCPFSSLHSCHRSRRRFFCTFGSRYFITDQATP